MRLLLSQLKSIEVSCYVIPTSNMRYNLLSGNSFKKLYYRAGSLILLFKEIISPPKNCDYKQIPIIINNFNRLESMKLLISALEDRGYMNIYIIDNLSTYPPLLEFYKSCPYTVFRLEKNIGSNAFWLSGICKHFYGE
ncbi:MAG: hypothetical protein MUP53_05890 [Bacteroidales bacterium]|nr:hypothetical protein [Bacteroidales bacterium]